MKDEVRENFARSVRRGQISTNNAQLLPDGTVQVGQHQVRRDPDSYKSVDQASKRLGKVSPRR